MAHSPYCTPITQALTALGVAFDRVVVPNWDRSVVIRIIKGAYYQVPVLVPGETIVHESSDRSLDVARYMDQSFAGGKLFPSVKAGIQEIIIEHFENELEGLTFKLCDIHYIPSIKDLVERAMVIRHKERCFGRGCVDAWRREEALLRRDADRLFGRFDAKLQKTRFLLGNDVPTYVDFALLGVVGNFMYGGHHVLSGDHVALRAWNERILTFLY
ncbi:MAG: glutathione S-transferase [Verrucomicrobiales bacterium]|jgi:glutathione S-transferase